MKHKKYNKYKNMLTSVYDTHKNNNNYYYNNNDKRVIGIAQLCSKDKKILYTT